MLHYITAQFNAKWLPVSNEKHILRECQVHPFLLLLNWKATPSVLEILFDSSNVQSARKNSIFWNFFSSDLPPYYVIT